MAGEPAAAGQPDVASETSTPSAPKAEASQPRNAPQHPPPFFPLKEHLSPMPNFQALHFQQAMKLVSVSHSVRAQLATIKTWVNEVFVRESPNHKIAAAASYFFAWFWVNHFNTGF